MLLVKNRKALFNYEIVEKYVAGIVLKGFEVKAIREGTVSFEGSYIKFGRVEDDTKASSGGSDKDSLVVVNMYIGPYSKQGKYGRDLDNKRPRALLLNQHELNSIKREVTDKGKTIVPLALVLMGGKIKLEMAVVKGRKEFEKKVVAKERQVKRDLETYKARELKGS